MGHYWLGRRLNNSWCMKIIQVGGGTTGWLSALAITKHLPNVDFTIIENGSPISVGEATFPTLNQFHNFLDIDESKFIRSSDATIKYAVRFDDFNQKDTSYFNSFGYRISKPIDRISEQFLSESPDYTNVLGRNKALDDWTWFLLENKLPGTMEKGEVKGHHGLDPTEENITTGFYAYHLNSELYQNFLKEQITTNYTHIQDTVTEIKINENGIEYIKIENNPNPMYADLFIDCTGFSQVLIKELGVKWNSLSNFLPNNTAIVHRRKYDDPEKEMCPYTRATGLKNGWMWTIPLYTQRSHGYVFSDSYTSINDAEIEFRQTLKLKDSDNCDIIHFKSGYADKPWIKNCVAIGLSSGFLEPLESTGIALSVRQIKDMVTVLNKGFVKQLDRDWFNQMNKIDSLQIKHFLTTHFIHTLREDTEYWRDWKYNRTLTDAELIKYNLIKVGKLVGGSDNNTLFFTGGAFEYIMNMHGATQNYNSINLKYNLSQANTLVDFNNRHLPNVKQQAANRKKQLQKDVKTATNNYEFMQQLHKMGA